MSGRDQSIVSMYEELEMTIEQIAQSEDLEELSVKACLMTHSSVYREALKLKSEDGFTEQDDLDARRTIRELMNSDDDHVSLRAAIFIRSDKKGRLDVKPKDMQQVNVTVNQFNLLLQKQKEVREKAKQRQLIDVPSSLSVVNS